MPTVVLSNGHLTTTVIPRANIPVIIAGDGAQVRIEETINNKFFGLVTVKGNDPLEIQDLVIGTKYRFAFNNYGSIVQVTIDW